MYEEFLRICTRTGFVCAVFHFPPSATLAIVGLVWSCRLMDGEVAEGIVHLAEGQR